MSPACTLLLASPPSRGTRRGLTRNAMGQHLLFEHQLYAVRLEVDLRHPMMIIALTAVTRAMRENIPVAGAKRLRRIVLCSLFLRYFQQPLVCLFHGLAFRYPAPVGHPWMSQALACLFDLVLVHYFLRVLSNLLAPSSSTGPNPKTCKPLYQYSWNPLIPRQKTMATL